jgi:hypothetical protein
MKIINIVFFTLLLAGCVTNYSKINTPYIDGDSISDEYKLKEGEEPIIISSNNIDYDIELLNNYVCIGSTNFNAPKIDIESDIRRQCLNNGAKIAIYQVAYTHTENSQPNPRYNSNNYDGSFNIVSILGLINDFIDLIIIFQKKDMYNYNVYYFIPLQLLEEETINIVSN